MLKKNKPFNPIKYFFLFILSAICFIYAIWLQEDSIKKLEMEKKDLLAKIKQYEERYLKERTEEVNKKRYPQELTSTSGILWQDPETKYYLISLGKEQGVKNGDMFIIKSVKTSMPVGKAKVISSSASSSIVEILDNSTPLKDVYYEVKYIENKKQ